MPPVLEFRALSHFYGSVCALRNVQLAVPDGATGLIGQNGAGKSTLLQIVLGMVRPTHGTAKVLGLDVAAAGTKLRGRLGYMPERDALVPGLSGVEYAALAGELGGMRRRQALRRAHEMLTSLGLEEARYRKVEQYSVGMLQRLKLAATLVHDPDLLLLDEPTSGLDPDGRTAMLEVLRSLAGRPGKSLLLATHLLSDVERVCSAAVILHRGQAVAAGRLDELRQTRRRAYRLQWEGDGTTFLAALRTEGAEIDGPVSGKTAEYGAKAGPCEVRVGVPDGWRTHRFFAAAVAGGVVLRGLEPEEEDLEAAYHRVVAAAKSENRAKPPSAEEAVR